MISLCSSLCYSISKNSLDFSPSSKAISLRLCHSSPNLYPGFSFSASVALLGLCTSALTSPILCFSVPAFSLVWLIS